MTKGIAYSILRWLAYAENKHGGIGAWKKDNLLHDSYPEVTGYLIPTLLQYGRNELAYRCADWLRSVQHESGAFPGMDGIHHTFDTAACMEGLVSAHHHSGNKHYLESANRARAWLKSMITDDGYLPRYQGESTAIYTMRASALIRSELGLAYWLPRAGVTWDAVRWGNRQRPHYIAYMLEGFWNMGERDRTSEILDASQQVICDNDMMPLWCEGEWTRPSGTDTCATAQFAILYQRAGLDASRLLNGVFKMIDRDGGVWHGVENALKPSWTAKYTLDLLYYG